MIHPKYSPEEALQRMKLMMEYDSSKTLSENEKLLKEDSTGWERGLAGAGTVGATAGGAFGKRVIALTQEQKNILQNLV